MYCLWLHHNANSEVKIQQIFADYLHTLTESIMGWDLSHRCSDHHNSAPTWIYAIPRSETSSDDTVGHVVLSCSHMSLDMSENLSKCYRRPQRVHCRQSGYGDRDLSWAELMLIILCESRKCTTRTYNDIRDFRTDCSYLYNTHSSRPLFT